MNEIICIGDLEVGKIYQDLRTEKKYQELLASSDENVDPDNDWERERYLKTKELPKPTGLVIILSKERITDAKHPFWLVSYASIDITYEGTTKNQGPAVEEAWSELKGCLSPID